jgi:glutamyl-tRNA synthetase
MVKQNKKEIRVRIAPSPTGFAHVGTAYTALFNWAFTKKNKGKLIIRLEDTDVKRHVKEAEGAIYDGLSWLGFDWDEGPDKGGEYGPYRQSERLKIYKEKSEELLKSGLAYKDEGAIRFKNPGEDIGWLDLVRGKISFPGGEITDFVIMKSDGYPTYNFAVVIDDLLMKITHIIRGEEHISNTPRQLALYNAFRASPPRFGHLPTLRNKDRKKLSKRRDPVDLGIYQDEGYLPEALVNFLCLLGWSHPDEKEVFNVEEFIKLFSLERVRSAGPIFDTDKLNWINGEYIRKLKVDELNSKIVAQNEKFKTLEKEKQLAITSLVQDRIKTLGEFSDIAGFFYQAPKINTKLLGKNNKDHLKKAVEVLGKIDEWKLQSINKGLMKLIDSEEFNTGKFFMDLRVAITGNKQTPPINESIEILGKSETLKRIKKVTT